MMDTYGKMTVEEAAQYVIDQLTPADIAYAADAARGAYRGFAALHDLMDANMLLPYASDDSVLDDMERYTRWCNLVMAAVTRLMLNPKTYVAKSESVQPWAHQPSQAATWADYGAAVRFCSGARYPLKPEKHGKVWVLVLDRP